MTIPYWFTHVEIPSFPSLRQNEKADVAIVGAGIAGLTCAYLLLKKGKTVIICDKDIPGFSGETAKTTGHLTYFLDDRFTELERVFGTDGLKEALDSHKYAVDLIEKIIDEEQISCDFERIDGFLFRAEGDDSTILHDELQAAARADYSLEFVSLPIENEAIKLKHQAQFHPLKYITGLMKSIKKLGGKIYGETFIEEIKEGIVSTRNHQILAEWIIVATNTPIHTRFVMHTKQAAYRTYALAASIEQGSYPKGLFYDTADPYHYIRLYGDDIVIIGGEDHKTGQNTSTQKSFKQLEKWARKHVPSLKEVVARWSGQIMEPVDSLGFLGKDPLENHLFLITGDSGNGLTHTTIGAMIIVDKILEKKSPFSHLYDPKRKTIKTLPSFVEENANVAKCYMDWLLLPQKEKRISRGEGMVVNEKGKKIAIYKDEQGKEHRFSAVCPHLGCIVHWNEMEKSWDCPCHGSRFSCMGKNLNGPAVKPLKEFFSS